MARNSLQHIGVTDATLAGEASGPRFARPLLTSLRIDQWTKNLIVFAALIFGHRLLELAALGRSFALLCAFCAISSATYLLNDVADRNEDRLHPVKARRPIASGQLSTGTARVAAGLLGFAGLVVAFGLDLAVGGVAVAYVTLGAIYSRVLKHLVILDVLAIAAGFVLRASAGALVIDVPISQWLLVCTMLLALFLALSKRRQELVFLGPAAVAHRRSLSEYTPELLDRMTTVVAAATLVSYAIYTTDQETVAKFGTTLLTLTIPFPIYGVFRYLYLVQQKQGGGNPAETLLRDGPLQVCVLLWVAAAIAIIYRPFGL